jgi:hypothetical protein
MASGSIAGFNPEATVVVAASTVSNAIALSGNGPSLLVFNSTGSIAFLSLGASTNLIATSQSLPIPAGSQVLLNVGATVTAAAVLLSSGTGTVYLTRGSGSAY